MNLTSEQEATVTMALVRHRTDLGGNCSCGRPRSARIGSVASVFTQEAHQAQVVAAALLAAAERRARCDGHGCCYGCCRERQH